MAAIVPREIGEWPSPAGFSLNGYFDLQNEMDIRGDKAFVNVRETGRPSYLVIFDLAQGPNPVKLSQLELSLSNTMQSISVSGNIALVGSRFGPSGIDIVDISDLTHPKLASVWFHPDPIAYNLSATAYQNVAYIHGPDSEFIVADVSDPSSPRILRTLPYYFVEFLADGSRGFGLGTGGLKIFDLSDPTNPALIGGSTAINGSTIVVSGSVAFVGGWGLSLLAVDLQDPASPKILSSLHYSNITPTPLAILGKILATSNGTLYDVSNLAKLLAVGALGPPAAVRTVSEHFVTFTVDSGLRVVDTTDPWKPMMRGFYPLGTGRPHTRTGDPHVYFTFSNLGLVIVDFSDISKPVVVSQADVPHSPDDIAFNGDIAYVFQSLGVTLIDISDPKKPVVGRSFDFSHSAFTKPAQFNNQHLYVYGQSVLNVYDATDPNALPLVDTMYEVYTYQLHGSVLYTSDFSQTLGVWDISDPSNRKLVAEYPGVGGFSMAIAGSQLVVSGNALRVFDISADGTLTLVEKFGATSGLLAASDSKVVSVAKDEISVFEIPETGAPRRSSISSPGVPGIDEVLFFGSSFFAHSTSLGTRIFDFDAIPGPTVTSPLRSSLYKSGQTLPITWTSGSGRHDWAISLYASPSPFGSEISITGAIAQTAENTFRVDWEIPESLETWSQMDAYQVVVRDKASEAQGFSDPFTIIDRPKLSYSDQRSDATPGIYLSWPARFNSFYVLYSKESLDAVWQAETENVQVTDPVSYHWIEGDVLARPQKFFTLLPKTP